MHFADGLHLVVKRDCPTCVMIEPVIRKLASHSFLNIYVQDNADFLADISGQQDDRSLERSYHLDIDTAPTLLNYENGVETDRVIGWHRNDWQALSGVSDLGVDLPDQRPGCGSKTVQPGIAEHLQVQFGKLDFKSRALESGHWQDEHEICYEQGWTDGLPVIPPTAERILRMLAGTARDPEEIIGLIPPNLAPCTIEKNCD